ncbi:hypothetical protein GGF32_000267 [Allomyces javanicus]|nr:hypothetical protein GGF32_000267 [Allomyces javanicus]
MVAAGKLLAPLPQQLPTMSTAVILAVLLLAAIAAPSVVSAAASSPFEHLSQPAAVYLPVEQKAYIFGGKGEFSDLQSTVWIWDFSQHFAVVDHGKAVTKSKLTLPKGDARLVPYAVQNEPGKYDVHLLAGMASGNQTAPVKAWKVSDLLRADKVEVVANDLSGVFGPTVDDPATCNGVVPVDPKRVDVGTTNGTASVDPTLYVFGAPHFGGNTVSKLYSYNVANGTATMITPTARNSSSFSSRSSSTGSTANTNLPDYRSSGNLVRYDATTLLLVGGFGQRRYSFNKTTDRLSDLWTFDIPTRTWNLYSYSMNADRSLAQTVIYPTAAHRYAIIVGNSQYLMVEYFDPAKGTYPTRGKFTNPDDGPSFVSQPTVFLVGNYLVLMDAYFIKPFRGVALIEIKPQTDGSLMFEWASVYRSTTDKSLPPPGTSWKVARGPTSSSSTSFGSGSSRSSGSSSGDDDDDDDDLGSAAAHAAKRALVKKIVIPVAIVAVVALFGKESGDAEGDAEGDLEKGAEGAAVTAGTEGAVDVKGVNKTATETGLADAAAARDQGSTATIESGPRNHNRITMPKTIPYAAFLAAAVFWILALLGPATATNNETYPLTSLTDTSILYLPAEQQAYIFGGVVSRAERDVWILDFTKHIDLSNYAPAVKRAPFQLPIPMRKPILHAVQRGNGKYEVGILSGLDGFDGKSLNVFAWRIPDLLNATDSATVDGVQEVARAPLPANVIAMQSPAYSHMVMPLAVQGNDSAAAAVPATFLLGTPDKKTIDAHLVRWDGLNVTNVPASNDTSGSTPYYPRSSGTLLRIDGSTLALVGGYKGNLTGDDTKVNQMYLYSQDKNTWSVYPHLYETTSTKTVLYESPDHKKYLLTLGWYEEFQYVEISSNSKPQCAIISNPKEGPSQSTTPLVGALPFIVNNYIVLFAGNQASPYNGLVMLEIQPQQNGSLSFAWASVFKSPSDSSTPPTPAKSYSAIYTQQENDNPYNGSTLGLVGDDEKAYKVLRILRWIALPVALIVGFYASQHYRKKRAEKLAAAAAGAELGSAPAATANAVNPAAVGGPGATTTVPVVSEKARADPTRDIEKGI